LRAKAHQKVARQRQDTGRKWAKKVVTDHDAIAGRLEDARTVQAVTAPVLRR
jgi:hypothetical protein